MEACGSSALQRPVPLEPRAAGGAGGVALRRLRERRGQVGVDVGDAADVVVELPDEPHVAAQVAGGPGLVVLVDLVDQQPVLVQYALRLHEALLEALQHLIALQLPAIADPREALSLHAPPQFLLQEPKNEERRRRRRRKKDLAWRRGTEQGFWGSFNSVGLADVTSSGLSWIEAPESHEQRCFILQGIWQSPRRGFDIFSESSTFLEFFDLNLLHQEITYPINPRKFQL